MKLYDTGVYLLNGQKIVPENQADFPVSKEEAAKSTIAYSILKAHNTSGNMEKLQIKFDKLTSHDIIFFLQLHPPNFNTLPFGFIHHFFLLVSPQGTYLIRLKCI